MSLTSDRIRKALAKQIFKLVLLLSFPLFDTMLDSALHMLWTLRCDLSRNSTGAFFKVVNGSWTCKVHKWLQGGKTIHGRHHGPKTHKRSISFFKRCSYHLYCPLYVIPAATENYNISYEPEIKGHLYDDVGGTGLDNNTSCVERII